MSFVSKIKSSSGSLVYLIRGKDQNKDAWYYVLVKDKVVLPVFLKEANGNPGGKPLDILKYGEILYSGWGKNPPQDIVDRIQEQYG